MRKRLNLFSILFAIWGIAILAFWLSVLNNTMSSVLTKDGYVRLIELFVFGGILLECLAFKRWNNNWDHRQKAMVIFFVALSVRIISLSLSQYIPSSDFQGYFNAAIHFVDYGFKEELPGYPMFAWKAIIDGLFLSILSPTLLGMQILNSLYTAGICVFIYLIGRTLNSKAALVGAILYTFYPISILSTHITTNHHGAVFFLLAGVYLFEITIAYSGKFQKRLLLLIACALCFAISNFYHPSIIIVLCSLIITMLINEAICLINSCRTYISGLLDDIKQFRGRFLLTIMVILIYEMIATGGMGVLVKSGYIHEQKENWALAKIVVGLNQETRGRYSQEDFKYAFTHTDEEVLAVIKERLSNPKDVIKLMAEKTKEAWYRDDDYGFFYTLGVNNQLSEEIETTSDAVIKEDCIEQLASVNQTISNIMIVDTLYINCIWLLAIVGIVILIMRYQGSVRIYSFLFIPMGWMAFITFTEMQSRYRYQSMPAVIFIAALGTVGIYDKLKLYLGK